MSLMYRNVTNTNYTLFKDSVLHLKCETNRKQSLYATGYIKNRARSQFFFLRSKVKVIHTINAH